MADLSVPYARWIAARGGNGGMGNAFFKSSTNQAPEYAQSGQPGEQFKFHLVLKSVADVGLVGLPNVGKSTLISTISAAHPKIADYPFTTLEPHLGVVMLSGERRFVIADIPGLIPGASDGKGLGIQFLKHIERTKTIAQIIDVSTTLDGLIEEQEAELLEDAELLEIIMKQFHAIDHELRAFSPEVADRPRLIIFSKADLPVTRRGYELARSQFTNDQVIMISSVDNTGLEELKEKLFQLIDKIPTSS